MENGDDISYQSLRKIGFYEQPQSLYLLKVEMCLL